MMERERPGKKKQIPEEWLGRPVKLVFISGSRARSTLMAYSSKSMIGALSCRLTSMWATQRSRCSTRGAPSSSSLIIQASAHGRELNFREDLPNRQPSFQEFSFSVTGGLAVLQEAFSGAAPYRGGA